MKSFTPTTSFSNSRAFLASILTCIILVTPLTPIGFASTSSSLIQSKSKSTAKQPSAPKSDVAPNVASSQQKDPPVTTLAVGPITATKTDNRTASQPVGPTNTINYTVTITNTGSDPANNVIFTDQISEHTTLVPGSIQSTPLANPDTFNVIGNVRIQPNAAQGLLANDFNPDNGNNSGITATGPTSSAQGGNVTINADGSFTYNPAPGFTGTDSFTYTITNTVTNKTDTTTATFRVGNGTATPGSSVIWFIDNTNAAAGRDGRITSPFNSIAEFNSTAADEAGDIIFIYTGNGTSYVGPVVLLNNQQLIGQGVSVVTATGFTVQPYSDALPGAGAAPAINSAAAAGSNTVTLNSTGAAGANTIRGVTLANATDSDIAGTNFGTLTVSDTTINGTGRALSLSNGTLAATFNSITSTASPSQGISLSSIGGALTSTGGTTISGNPTQCVLVSASSLSANFGNTSCTGGTDGISLQNNSGANTRTFGTLNVSGGSGNAFLHGAGGGNTVVSGAASLTSNNNPIEIQNAGNGQTISFAATTVTKTTAGGAGVNWGGTNTGATLSFASLSLTTSNGSGLVAAGGGTINVTTGTISATGSAGQIAPAISANGVTFNATFTSVTSTNSGNSGNGIFLANFPGTLTINSGSISGAAGDAFLVSGTTNSTANITYNGTITTSTARPVNVSGKTGGTVSFGGVPSSGTAMISSTSNGVLLNSNTGATINFTGGLSLSTGTNDAFAATGGGTVNVTQNNSTIVNTLATTTGTALKVTNTTIGASRLTFRSINSTTSGANNGIILDTTGTSGGLTVSANGGTCTNAATCTGGTISNKTGGNGSTTQGTGIYLNNTSGVSLDRMQLNDFQNYAIFGSSVTGFSLTSSNISGANGDNNAGGVEEGSIRFNNLFTSGAFPTAQITNSTISGGGTFNVLVFNNTNASTLNRLVMSNNTFGLISGSIGNDNVSVIVRPISPNTATANVSLLNNIFNGTRSDFFEATADGNSTMDVIARQNKFTNGQAIIPGGGVGVSLRGDVVGTASNMTFDVSCNRIVGGHSTVGMFVAKGNGGGTWSGAIVNNVIGPQATPTSNADGLFVRAAGSGSLSVLIQNNAITGYGNDGLHLQNNDGSVTMNATIYGNSMTAPTSAFPHAAMFIDNGGTATDTTTMNAVVGSATNAALQNTFSAPGGGVDVSLGNFSATNATKFNLSRNGSGAGTPAGVIQDDNVGTPTVDTTAGNGPITLVNTLPTVPATPASCSVPAAAQIRDLPVAGDENKEVFPANIAAAAPSQTETPQSFAVIPRPSTNAALAQPGAMITKSVAPTVASSQAGTEEADKAAAKTPVEAAPMVANFPITIGTLGAGKSVTITFSVTVNNPLAPSVTQISNQGTVSGVGATPGTEFSVQTDDPDVAGTQATITPVIPQPTITINNASAPEPASGSAPMPFSVVLSGAYTVPVTVNFQTADGTATQSIDYTSTSGTLSFAAGETFQTISVPVLADADSSESNEDFTVTLSAPANGAISGTGIATGTITTANPPGRVLISEVRTSGPNGAGDDFIELYNNQDVSQVISGWAIVKSASVCSATPIIVAVIPANTTIPARGHYLITGPAYSLAASVPGNATVAAVADIESDRNLGLFNTSNLLNLSTATREDAVGFDVNAGGGNNCDLLREGASLLSAGGSASQHSFTRNLISGLPKETNDNAADFLLVTTTPATAVGNNLTPALGAPGPENLAAPIQRNGQIKSSLVDGTVAANAPPNRVRSGIIEPGVPNAFGTLSIQRKFTNTLAVPVTRLRFRIVDLTTINNRPAGAADLRVLSSTGVVRNSAGTIVRTVNGLTLEAPPQPNGGGLNSALTVVLPGGMLAPGNSIEVQFLLGVQEQGNFSFFVNVEALPGPAGAAGSILDGAATKGGTTEKQRSAETATEPNQPQP
jgi:hypothetical protein